MLTITPHTHIYIYIYKIRSDKIDYFILCSIQTKGIQNAQNGNLQTFPLATARLVFVKGLLIVNTVSSLMLFIK
jgi:hypothetical protein